MVLTCMTFNVGNGLVRPQQLIALLRRSDADVVALQEVQHQQADSLALLADRYPHQLVRGSGFTGRALLSRFPLLDAAWLHLQPGSSDLQAVLDINGEQVTVICAHPLPQRLQRGGLRFDASTLAQIDQLGDIAAAAAPAVLLGDFNMTPRHPAYAALQADGLLDAHAEVGRGRGHTFPMRLGRTRRVNHRLSWVPLPRLARIDYIWHTPDLEALAAWTVGAAGSDHLPVVARLQRRVRAIDAAAR